MRNFVLKSSDDQTFEIEEKFGRESKVIHLMIKSGCADYSTITLRDISGEIVAKIIEYFNLRHAVNNDDGDGNSSSLEEALKKFDVEFVDGLDSRTLLYLFVVARSLDMNMLMDAMIEKICNTVKGKSPDEIRAIFNFFYDVSTPEEEARIRVLIEKIE